MKWRKCLARSPLIELWTGGRLHMWDEAAHLDSSVSSGWGWYVLQPPYLGPWSAHPISYPKHHRLRCLADLLEGGWALI